MKSIKPKKVDCTQIKGDLYTYIRYRKNWAREFDRGGELLRTPRRLQRYGKSPLQIFMTFEGHIANCDDCQTSYGTLVSDQTELWRDVSKAPIELGMIVREIVDDYLHG